MKKLCSRCREEKGLSEFFIQKYGRFGVRAECKDCHREYKKLRRQGEDGKIKDKLIREHVSREGKGYKNKNGYVYLYRKGHPNAQINGYMLEHRYVMSMHLGRPLKKNETVHHKNGVKHDNRLENLELFSQNHGSGEKVNDKIEWCIGFLKSYGYKVIKE